MSTQSSQPFPLHFKSVVCCVLTLLLLLSSSISILADTSMSLTPVDPEDYFGRTQLSTLSNSESLIYAYDQIAQGVDESSKKIPLANQEKGYHINYDEFQTVLKAYLGDYPHHFWLGKQYSYNYRGEDIVSFVPTYIMEGSVLENAKKQFDRAAKQFLKGLNQSMSELQKEELLHDAIATETDYESTDNAHNAYGCLVENKAVCEGYAEALQYLLYQAGILNVVVTGNSKLPNSNSMVGHAWNLVRIDGDYYYVDVTWDDQTVGTFHEYFNITTELLLEDHALNQLAYDYPLCTATKANYFQVHGGSVFTFSIEEVIEGFDKNGNHFEIFLPNNSFAFWQEFQKQYAEIIKQMDFVDKPTFVCYTLGHERYVKFTGHRRGDVNEDALFNQDDLTVLENHLNGTAVITDATLLKAADMDKDSTVTKEDYRLLHLRIVGTEPPSTNPKPPIDQPITPIDPPVPPVDLPVPPVDQPVTPIDPPVEPPVEPVIAVMGDIDEDGKLDATDALAVLKNAVGKKDLTPQQIKAADLNGDNAINAADALIILRKAVGKE